MSEETKKYVQQHKYMTKAARKGERDTLHIISDIKKKGLNEGVSNDNLDDEITWLNQLINSISKNDSTRNNKFTHPQIHTPWMNNRFN